QPGSPGSPGRAARQAAPQRQQAAPAVVPPPGQTSSGTLGDAIVAVVNNEVITRRELDERVSTARASLADQGIQAPPPDVLDRQVLDRVIADTVQLQEADRIGVRVSDDQIDMTIQRIAEQNNASVAQMRQQLEKDGVAWNVYRADLRDQIRMNRVREQELDRTIFVSESEIDAFLAEQSAQQGQPGAQAASGALQLAQILVRVPEGSSPTQIEQLRNRANQLLAQARGGADFAQLAAASSDGDEALRGGDLGARPTVGWPDVFVRATSRLQPGQVSDVVQSGNGFHILKVVAREGGSAQAPGGLLGPAGPQQVTQHRARHILLRTTAVRNDDQARAQLEQLRTRITQGGSAFADLARQYSDDASAPQGGDLGWLSPGETVPEFENAMQNLQPGQVSQPVRSQFGWHLIVVEDRRVQDIGDQSRRMQARQILFQRKLEPAWADWVGMLRSRAYVDNRLERDARL
ncbi:peptidylprolyl isomerase, partial [Achromobacter sp. GG226]|uniref:peptidylprolyl isomerase n=1 Tax=Verticiella alkaliphila TaxID=2779529 RepID=UPI001C0CB454